MQCRVVDLWKDGFEDVQIKVVIIVSSAGELTQKDGLDVQIKTVLKPQPGHVPKYTNQARKPGSCQICLCLVT